jgi:hypothetical protein
MSVVGNEVVILSLYIYTDNTAFITNNTAFITK